MTTFIELNFAEYSLNEGSSTKIPIRTNICVCCVAFNVPFINLASCKHTAFFEYLFNNKVEDPNVVICRICHNELRKFDLFRTQVEESFKILKNQSLPNAKKLHNLKRSDTTINSTINSQPITTEIKAESTIEPDYNTTTEVKIEHDSSDLDTDVPLAQIKKEIKKTKRKKTKSKSTPHGKYEGKIRIVTLSTEELMEERERDRCKEMYQKLPFKCENCITGFDHDVTLNEHLDKRHTEKKGSSVCNICQSVLNTERSYKEHCKRHFRRYECEECGKRNNTLHVLIKHYKERHGSIDTLFTCQQCGFTTEYEWEECGKRNNTLHVLIKHYKERHGSIDTLFTCQQCGFTTESHRGYRYHRDKHKEKQQCTECGNTFVNKTALKVHMFTVHSQSSRRYSCASCKKWYRAKSGLLAHRASAHTAASGASYCAPCAKHFRTPANLRHHLRTHSVHVSDCDKRFACDECGAKFLTKPSLQEHVNWLHLNSTTHECTLCSKVFKNGSALKKHRDFVHEKKRPPRNKICDHCGRGFTTLAILRCHIRTHTGERPLRCAHCAACFAHSAALYTHNKLLHNSLRQ